MNFKTYLDNAWKEHAHKALEVSQQLSEGLKLVQNEQDIEQLARLSTHVFGEHLGQWTEGIDFLNKIKLNKFYINTPTLENSISIFNAALELALDSSFDFKYLSLSSQIRVLALTTGFLAEHHQPEKAKDYFSTALNLADSGLLKDDPANKTLAIAANNLACQLEERALRTQVETELMLLSAQIARKFWEIAGTWKEVSTAEYRLSQSYLKAKQINESLLHAHKCLEICDNNTATPLDYFFAYESIALAEFEKNNQVDYELAVSKLKNYFSELSEADKSWCEVTLETVIQKPKNS